jgi:hypothetical protein
MEKDMELVSRALMRLSKVKLGMAESAALMVCNGKSSDEIAELTGTTAVIARARMNQLRHKGMVGVNYNLRGVVWHRSIVADLIIRDAIGA